jgi:hypothetical protein
MDPKSPLNWRSKNFNWDEAKLANSLYNLSCMKHRYNGTYTEQ